MATSESRVVSNAAAILERDAVQREFLEQCRAAKQASYGCTHNLELLSLPLDAQGRWTFYVEVSYPEARHSFRLSVESAEQLAAFTKGFDRLLAESGLLPGK